jgi:hypothetical protein
MLVLHVLCLVVCLLVLSYSPVCPSVYVSVHTSFHQKVFIIMHYQLHPQLLKP